VKVERVSLPWSHPVQRIKGLKDEGTSPTNRGVTVRRERRRKKGMRGSNGTSTGTYLNRKGSKARILPVGMM